MGSTEGSTAMTRRQHRKIHAALGCGRREIRRSWRGYRRCIRNLTAAGVI
jgi:hypothetical protein